MSDSMNLVDVLGQGGKLAASQFGLSSIDNLVNLGLTLFTPKPPKPTDLKLEKYNTDLNVNDRLSSVDNTVGNYNRSLAGMGLGAGAEAAAKLGASTNAMTQKNQIFADKENYKNSMLNKNVDLTNQELSYNNQLGNNYENALYQHKLQKLGAISGNVSDFVSGGVNALKTGIDFNMDINKAMMIAKANPEVAANMLDIPIFATLAKKDPAFAAGIKQAIINNKRGDKAAQWNQMFPNDQIDSTWSSYGGQQAVDAADLADIERLSKLGPYAFGEDKPAAQTTNPSGELVSSYDIAQPQAQPQAGQQAETGLMSLMTPEEQQMYNTNPEYKAYIDQAGEAGIQIWRDKNKRPQEEISNVAPLETPRVSSGLGDYAVQRPNYASSAPSTSTPSLTEEQRLNSLKTQAETELETARLNSLEQQAKEGEKWANSEEYKKMYGAPNAISKNEENFITKEKNSNTPTTSGTTHQLVANSESEEYQYNQKYYNNTPIVGDWQDINNGYAYHFGERVQEGTGENTKVTHNSDRVFNSKEDVLKRIGELERNIKNIDISILSTITPFKYDPTKKETEEEQKNRYDSNKEYIKNGILESYNRELKYLTPYK